MLFMCNGHHRAAGLHFLDVAHRFSSTVSWVAKAMTGILFNQGKRTVLQFAGDKPRSECKISFSLREPS